MFEGMSPPEIAAVCGGVLAGAGVFVNAVCNGLCKIIRTFRREPEVPPMLVALIQRLLRDKSTTPTANGDAS